MKLVAYKLVNNFWWYSSDY